MAQFGGGEQTDDYGEEPAALEVIAYRMGVSVASK
jgi:hypothetical protein